MAHMLDVATGKLDLADADLARATIQTMVAGRSFSSFLRSPGTMAGHPIATGAARVGGARPTVVLPAETVRRQTAEGTLPQPADWMRVQAMIDAGRTARQGNVRHVTLDGEPYVMEVERGEDGRIKVTSLRRAGT